MPKRTLRVTFLTQQKGFARDIYRTISNPVHFFARQEQSPWAETSNRSGGFEPSSPVSPDVMMIVVDVYDNEIFREHADPYIEASEDWFPFSWQLNQQLNHQL